MHRFSKFPLLKLAPSFVIGCLLPTLDYFTPDLIWLLTISIFSFIAILFVGKSMNSGFGVFNCISLIALGAAVSTALQPKLSDPGHYESISTVDSSIVVLGTPDGSPTRTLYGKKLLFNLKYCRLKGIIKSTSGRILVHIKTYGPMNGPHPGGLYALKIQLRIPSPASIPGGFDWKNHLKNKGVYHEGWVSQSDILELNRPNGISAFSNQCKEYVQDVLFRSITNKASLGVASALLMGNENFLDSETENNFAAAGVLHVLCVSGMHLVLLYSILVKLFKPLLRKIPRINHFIFPFLVCTIWFYALLTGMSPSITRAATMTTFVILSEWLERRVDKTNLLCASMILLCCLDPLMFLSAGFQLSFLAVCGIFYLHPIILSATEPGKRVTRQVWEMISVTFAAQLATFPLSLFLFGQFPNWFLLANLVIVPVSTVVMYVGMILILLGNISWIGEWLGKATEFSLDFLRYLVEFISSLPYAVTQNIYFTALMVLSTYVLIILLFYFFKSNSFSSFVGLLLAIFLFITIIQIGDQDFKQEDSCWIMKSKSGPIFVKQQGIKAEILVLQEGTETELRRIESTLATKRNVKVFKITTLYQKTNFNLKLYHATYVHQLPKMWNQYSGNLKYLDNTRSLILGRKPNEDFWYDLEKSMPNLKRLIFLKRVYLSEKSRAKADSLGIQIFNLDELGYIRLESKLVQ